MGFSEVFSDFCSALSFAEEVHAEAPADDEGGSEEGEDSKDGGEEGEESEGGDDAAGGEEEEEEEEEEDDEPEDLKPKLEEECANSSQCAPFKHHFDECVERVTEAQNSEEHKGPHEDCVEECMITNSSVLIYLR
ncbi:MAG: hypothetical protein M4579_001008 [Chaenotheca gracillima]|nr:MAG: hypothetical protein M4579_001008 [Chaenotheca gracillima]